MASSGHLCSKVDQNRVALFRGVQTGSVDDKGRLKLPASVNRALRRMYEESDLFVTSLDGESVKAYPISQWEVVETMLARPAPGPEPDPDAPLKNKILFQANHWGAEEKVDAQGRVLVPAQLREAAGMKGTVRIQWQKNHFLIMNESKYAATAEEYQISDEEMKRAQSMGL